MRKSEAAKLAQNAAIDAKFVALKNAGLEFENEAREGTGAHHVVITIPVFGYKVFDLSATAPERMLLEMLRQAYAQGLEEGTRTAEEESLENLVAAFPKLDRHIKSIAEDAANEVIAARLSNL